MFGHWSGEMPTNRGRRRMRPHRRAKYNVPVNIIEHDREFELWLFAHHFPKENIKVAVVEDTLYITGNRTPEVDRPNFILHEFPIKSFERSFELSHRVDKSKVKALYDHGILKVYVGKTAQAQKTEIDIEIE